MAGHKLHQPSVFGRIGTSLGSYLAESVPKEIERSRLSSGLKDLANKKDLTPFQQFAELSAIPGITPQAIESGSRLLEKQRKGEGLGAAYGVGAEEQDSGQQLGKEDNKPIYQEGLSRSMRTSPELTNKGVSGVRTQPVGKEEFNQPQVNKENLSTKKYVPNKPFSMERRQKTIGKYLSANPQLLAANPEEAHRLAIQQASEEESRYLAMPAAEQAIYEHKEHVTDVVEKKFLNSLADKLQKKVGVPGERELFSDISGEQLSEMKRGLERDLVESPESAENSIINDWSNRALELAKTNSRIKELKEKGFLERLTETESVYQKLIDARDIYSKTGSSETYKDMIKKDFGLSDQAASSIAYPMSERIQGYLKGLNKKSALLSSPSAFAKIANEVLNNITPNDSIASVVYYLRDKYPYFSESYFYDMLRENKENLTPSQQAEVSGSSNQIPNWADIFIMPTLSGRLK